MNVRIDLDRLDYMTPDRAAAILQSWLQAIRQSDPAVRFALPAVLIVRKEPNRDPESFMI